MPVVHAIPALMQLVAAARRTKRAPAPSTYLVRSPNMRDPPFFVAPFAAKHCAVPHATSIRTGSLARHLHRQTQALARRSGEKRPERRAQWRSASRNSDVRAPCTRTPKQGWSVHLLAMSPLPARLCWNLLPRMARRSMAALLEKRCHVFAIIPLYGCHMR